MVIEPRFDDAVGFEDGVSRVTVLGQGAYITKAGSFVVDPFPGRTLPEVRANMETAAARTLARIAGPWVGPFGKLAFVRMTVDSDGAVHVIALEPQGWRAVYSGYLADESMNADTAVLRFTGTTSETGGIYRATLTGGVASGSLTGALRDGLGFSVGGINLSRGGD